MRKLYNEYCKTYKLNNDNCDGFFDVVGSVYFSDEVQSLKQYEQHLEINRLQHITSVAYITYKVCKRLGLDYKSASRCACMHDLFYYDWRDGDEGKWHKPHGYKHPKFAALNAKELCPDLSENEIQIIYRHMWPLSVFPPKSKEGWVVSLADKYCANRELLYSISRKYKKRFIADIERI